MLEEEQIDEEIMNVERVLDDINGRIREKYSSGWFGVMRDSLYRQVEKQSGNFSKSNYAIT